MADRGQAYTLQGIIGAILVASALIVGLQAVDISPWTGGTSERSESLRIEVQDVLAAASDRDLLRTAATCIDGDGDGTPHPAVAAGGTPNGSERSAFGTLLNRTLDANEHSYNVYVDYHNASASDGVRTIPLTRERDVTRPSVTVVRRVALFDSDPVLRFDPDRGECVPTFGTNATLGTRATDPNRDIYIGDQGKGDVYAVVRVRVVAW